MGLDLSPGGARWSYSGFHRYRLRLAEAIGVDLETVFNRGWVIGPNGENTDPWVPGEEPLFLLLNHSDCEGELSPDACLTVLPRLLQVVIGWEKDPRDEGYDEAQTIKLACGMVECIIKNQPLLFH